MPSDTPLRLPQVTSSSSTPAEAEEDTPKHPLSSATEAFRSSLVSALEEASAGLARLQAAGNGRPARVAEELGAMALGPLDPERFAALLDPAEAVDPRHLRRYEEAVAELRAAVEGAATGPEEVEVTSGEGLRDAVAQALERRGRAFGAVRTLALLRTGGFREDEHGHLLEGLPFRQWRSLERELSPPLVVHVDGSVMETVSGLSEFLDGSQKLVLHIAEPSPPAPLARLLASGVLVLQTNTEEDLAALAGFEGPGIAALVPDSAARFEYRPAGPGEGGESLTVHHLPDTPPRAWIGGMSPTQQQSDLRLLEAWDRRLREAPAAEEAPGTGADPGGTPPSSRPDPAERLAAWLLSQAELDDAPG